MIILGILELWEQVYSVGVLWVLFFLVAAIYGFVNNDLKFSDMIAGIIFIIILLFLILYPVLKSLYSLLIETFQSLLILFSNPTIQLLLISLLIVLLLIIIVFLTFENVIRNKSEYVKRLITINNDTSFYKLNSEYRYKMNYSKKNQFDSISPELFLKNTLVNVLLFEKEITYAQENKAKYEEYLGKTEQIKSSNILLADVIKHPILKKIVSWFEIRVISKIILHSPELNPKFVVELDYQSPQGRNSYKKESTYKYQELIDLKRKVDIEQERLNSVTEQKRLERQKLTPKVRYKILKRDNYSCNLCGRTATSNVVLHVDHKIPIANGGKTVESNLWVLCEECNLGKGTRSL